MSVWHDATGSASVLVVGVVAIVSVVGVSMAGAAALLVERHRVASTADAAALAAADTLVGLLTGDPCGAARRVAGGSRTTLVACLIEGSTVTIRLASDLGPLPVAASATAGQAGDALGERRVDAKK